MCLNAYIKKEDRCKINYLNANLKAKEKRKLNTK